MVISSLVFALLHSANVLSGLPILTVALTVVFTFGFGVLMYLTLRVTGNLIWPMLVHGLYDPTLFLATGGIGVSGLVWWPVRPGDEFRRGPQSVPPHDQPSSRRTT